MKKKILIGASVIVLIIILVAISFFTVDKVRAKNGEKPMFCIKNPAGTILDGGTTEYFGLGYKVIAYNKLNGYNRIHIGLWSMEYDYALGEEDNFKYELKEVLEKYSNIQIEDKEKTEEFIKQLEYGNYYKNFDYLKLRPITIHIRYDKVILEEELQENSIALFLAIPDLEQIEYEMVENTVLIKRSDYQNLDKIKQGNEYGYETFYGKVVDTLGIYEEVAWAVPVPGSIQITIEPTENDPIRNSADKIVVYLKEYDGNNYEIGTKVKVTYTGTIKETYPAVVDAIKITELENKTVDMYIKMLEDLIKQDDALNTDAKFIAIDFENFLAYHKERDGGESYRSLSPNEKKALLEYCKQYNDNVIEANFKQLKEQGHFNEETMSLDGILISVEKTERIKEDKAIITMGKYRSGLGAIWPKYEIKLKNDYYWELSVLSTAIS